MPHYYFNAIIEAFNEMTAEALKQTANMRFIKVFGGKLCEKFMVVTPTAMRFCMNMEINLDDNLTDDEIEQLATASLNALDNLYICLSESFAGVSRLEFINNLPPKSFSVKLN